MKIKTKMTIFGIGHKAGIPTVLYLALTIYLSSIYTVFIFPSAIEGIGELKGWLLLVVGGGILVLSAVQLVFAYANKKLAKNGIYRVVVNPLYANAVVFLIPGLALILNSWLVLTSSFVLYFLYRHYIHEEYEWLAATFGKEYEDYYKSVIIKWL